MRPSPRAVGALAVAALGLLSACGSSTTTSSSAPTTTAPRSSAAGELFVVTAQGGTLGEGSLELTGVDAAVTDFADRPGRSAGEQQIADLVHDWADLGFVDDPPNAAVVTRGKEGLSTTVVELGRPVVSGTSVTFPTTPVGSGKAHGTLSRMGPGAPAGDLDEPAVFIDAGSTGTLVPVTITGTWGSGDTRVALDFWDFSSLGGASMGFQMGEAGTIRFTAYESFFSLRAPDALSGTFSGVGLMDDPTTLGGQASVPAGSELSIQVCDGGPTAPLTSGDFELDVPASC